MSTASVPAVSRGFLALLLAVTGSGLVTMTLCLPSMPYWGALLEVSQDRVQLTFAAFVLGFGGAQVIYGPLSDRHGRRPVLLVGLAIATVGSLVCALAPGLEALVGGRFLQGTGTAAGMALGRAMVQDRFSQADRSRVMAYVGMVMGLCPPCAMILGGQLHVNFGWRASFVAATVLCFALWVTSARLLPRDRPASAGELHWLRVLAAAYARLLREPAYLAYCAILAMCTGAFYVFLSGLPVVLAGYGVGAGAIGWYVAAPPVCYIAGNFFAARLLRHTSETRLMFLGQFTTLAGIGTSLALAAAGVNSPLAVAAPLGLLGMGHGLLMPSTLAGTVSLVPALAGAAAAGAGLAQQFAGAFGSYLVGLVSHHDAVNLGLLLLLFMGLSLVAQVVLLRLYRGAAHGG